MTRIALIFIVANLVATSTLAGDKEETCGYQAQVVAAIQAARLDRVREPKVKEHILAQEPEWPETYNTTIPLIAPWVYEQKRSVLRQENLSEAWQELCLQNWEQIKELSKNQ